MRPKRYVIALGLSLSSPLSAAPAALGARLSPSPSTGIQKIKHVVIIMQENRSFDSYFGTYPRADGISISLRGHERH